MTNNENKDSILLFEVFIQHMALQKLLIDKNICTHDEIQLYINNETALILKPFLEKCGVSSDELSNVIDTLIKNRKK